MQEKRLGINWLKIFIIACFAISMAYLEAAIVTYVREILLIGNPEEVLNVEAALSVPYFSLLKEPLSVIPHNILIIEIFREISTIIMLLTFAILVGKKWLEKAAVFFLSFGLWDLFYYLFLYVLLKWPYSLKTIDVLFLIPLPWVAPVWVPILVSSIMVCSSLFIIIKYRLFTDRLFNKKI